jgi:hypothetical protein
VVSVVTVVTVDCGGHGNVCPHVQAGGSAIIIAFHASDGDVR